MEEIYFDNAATTRTSEDVVECMNKMFFYEYGNPSALHKKGYLAEKCVKESLDIICDILKCEEKEIIFTSGGTESNNMAIFGCVNNYKKNGKHIITTSYEHPSVLNVFKELENSGYDVSYLTVDRYGKIDINELKNLLNENTILVSIMQVNNEIGSLNDLEIVGNVIKDYNKNIIFHSDFVQSFGKIKTKIKDLKIDMFSMSGHKIFGPKGIGFLYKNKNISIKPLIFGGGQQYGLRSGTLNTHGIVGLAKAVENVYDDFDNINKYVTSLRDYLISSLLSLNLNEEIVKLNTKSDNSFAPHIVSCGFKNIKSEVLLHTLEEKNIFVSSGSACSSKNKNGSKTLSAIGIEDEYKDNVLRFSLSKYNKKCEIDYLLNILKNELPKLSKYIRK